jgi:hypothetical protein
MAFEPRITNSRPSRGEGEKSKMPMTPHMTLLFFYRDKKAAPGAASSREHQEYADCAFRSVLLFDVIRIG